MSACQKFFLLCNISWKTHFSSTFRSYILFSTVLSQPFCFQINVTDTRSAQISIHQIESAASSIYEHSKISSSRTSEHIVSFQVGWSK